MKIGENTELVGNGWWQAGRILGLSVAGILLGCGSGYYGLRYRSGPAEEGGAKPCVSGSHWANVII